VERRNNHPVPTITRIGELVKGNAGWLAVFVFLGLLVFPHSLFLLLRKSTPSTLANLNFSRNSNVIELIHIVLVMRDHPWRAVDPLVNFLDEFLIFLRIALRFLVISECPPAWQINVP